MKIEVSNGGFVDKVSILLSIRLQKIKSKEKLLNVKQNSIFSIRVCDFLWPK